MISADSQALLNSSTTTVSSFSYLSFCLFPSSSSSSATTTTTTTTATESERRPSLSFPSSLCLPWLPLLLITFSVLMCQELVYAAPPAPLLTSKYNFEKQFPQKNLTSYRKPMLPEEMAQNDEPPRDLSQSVGVPGSWHKQPQDRMYYLRAQNDQYLQLYQGHVTGTKESKPPFGIVRFLSHKENIVIRSYLENQYLCMDGSSALYLTNNGDNPECYIKEESLQDNGSFATVYYFTKYSHGRMFYLGINCDPMLGTQTNSTFKSSRFYRQDVSDAEAKAVKEALAKSGVDSNIRAKCVSPAEKRKAARAKRQKLKWRWCWNIERMIQRRTVYMDRCMRREKSRTCDKSRDEDGEPKQRCVCDILRAMLLKPKRARRKCLADKLTKWVENRNATSNSVAVIEASRLLVRNYPAIARRIRLLKARKNKQKQQEEEKKRLLGDTATENNTQAPLGQLSVTGTNVRQTVSSVSHDPASRNGHRRGRHRRRRHRRIIRLKKLLDRYGRELFLSASSGEATATVGTSSSSARSPNPQPSSSHPKTKLPSVLSSEFRQALNSLSSVISRSKHRVNHKRRRHRRRQHKSTSTDNRKLANSDPSSPG